MNYSSDRKLIAGCLAGKSDAMEAFIRRFSDPVYRAIQYAFRSRDIRYTKEDLEDLHNSVFLSLFEGRCKKLRQYKGKNGCSLHSWIRLITVRTVIDHLRKTFTDAVTRRKDRVSIEILDILKSYEQDPDDLLDTEGQLRLIRKEMKELLPRDRLFLILHFQEGLSIREIAGIMTLSEENAYSLKHRAIDRLRRRVFSNYIPSPGHFVEG